MPTKKRVLLQNSLAGLAVLVLGHYSPAIGSTISLSTADNEINSESPNQGWWNATLSNYIGNSNYIVGNGIGGPQEFRDFFTFDLSALTGQTVTSATLEVQRYNGGDATLGLFDVSTNAIILNTLGAANAAVFADLGTGNSYGTFVVGTGDPADILGFSLNAAAITDINAAIGGFFSIGGAMQAGPGNELFATSNGGTPEFLVVTTTTITPEPNAKLLFACGLAVLAGRGRVSRGRTVLRNRGSLG